MGRPKTVYRGKRRYRWIISAVLIVLAVLIVGAVWLFYYMQRYIVYYKDGLSLVLPFMEQADSPQSSADPEAEIYTGAVDAEIVVSEPDFSDIDLGAGEGLTELHAGYIPAGSVTAANLNYYAPLLEGQGKNALVMQLKTPDGYLSYRSSVALTDSYGVNGAEDIAEAVTALSDREVYLVAEISTLLDTAMATRNTPLALKTGSGAVAGDSSGSWLDPYNTDVREYMTSLLTELADMGFDEVLLTGLAFPETENVVMSQPMTQTPSAETSVSAFAVFMSETARSLGMKCSVCCETDAVRSGTGLGHGQRLSLFPKIFDRLYVKTDSDHQTADALALRTFLPGDNAARIVPISSAESYGGSWCVTQ